MLTSNPAENPSGEFSQSTNDPSFIHQPGSRLQSLDTLRGIGIIGALFISIWMFGGFSNNQQNGLLLQSKGTNYRIWGLVELLLDGKMRALICFVFGAGMVLFLTRPAAEKTLSVSDLFIRRQLWLIAFGIVNAFALLWQGDLLFHLGIMGIFLFPFVRLKAKNLLVAAIVTTIIFCAKNYWNYAEDQIAYTKFVAAKEVEKKITKDSLLAVKANVPLKDRKKDSLSKQQQEDTSAWAGIAAAQKFDPKKSEDGFKEMRSGSIGTVWNYLLPLSQFKEAQWTYQVGIWDLTGMILLGMTLFKWGFFNPGFPRKKYILPALVGLAGGLLLGWFRLQYHQYVLQDYVRYVIHQWQPYDLYFPLERALLALGYASAILWLMRMGILKFVWFTFARIGQMALSNYLLQSIFCTIFFAGIGMGYFGRLLQYQLYLFVVEITIVQIVFSILWLRYFYHGPAEWLLKCLVNKRWLPNKIRRERLPVPVTTALS